MAMRWMLILVAAAGVTAVCVSCSSSTAAASAALECSSHSGLVTHDCECNAVSGGRFTANNEPCSAALLGPDSACFTYRGNSNLCSCVEFRCGKNGSNVTCGFHVDAVFVPDGPASPASCSGTHACMVSDLCTCGSQACKAGEIEVASCTDAHTKQKLLESSPDYSDTQVSDCREALGGANGSSSGGRSGAGGTSGSSGGMTTCNDGPGTCTFPKTGDHCRNGAACQRPSATSDYACLVSCKTDADCAGFCTGGSSPTPLHCDNGTAGQSFPFCK